MCGRTTHHTAPGLFQNDYAREAIPWTFTEFQDNRACLDVMEGKPGLFAVLNEVILLLCPYGFLIMIISGPSILRLLMGLLKSGLLWQDMFNSA